MEVEKFRFHQLHEITDGTVSDEWFTRSDFWTLVTPTLMKPLHDIGVSP